jgi:glucose/arabinose dehydrogenase
VVDHDGDGDFTDSGSQTAAIVRGIPRDDHGLNHIQIVGDSLYVGNGVRTRNGDFQTFTGDTFGESAYGGTILKIVNLNNVETVNDSAGFYPPTPNSAQYANLVNGTDPVASSPFTSVADDKLRVVASGARNPFGLAVDKNGDLFFTNNFQRVENHIFDRNNTGPSASLDAFGGDGFSDDVHDQFFKVAELADYGYRNTNWQNNSQATSAVFFAASNS